MHTFIIIIFNMHRVAIDFDSMHERQSGLLLKVAFKELNIICHWLPNYSSFVYGYIHVSHLIF